MDPMLPRMMTVKDRRGDAVDTFILELADDGDRVPLFLPGQFNMLYAFGMGEVPLSIGGVPGAQLLHIVRSIGTVTNGLSHLRPGDQLGIRGPFGSSWPLEEALGKDLILIGGGLGLAALHSALCQIASRRQDYRDVTLLYGARTPANILCGKEFECWDSHGIKTFITVDRGNIQWHGRVGVVTTLVSRVTFDPRHCIALICGPEIMMRFSILELKKHDVPDTAIFISMERNMKCATGFCGHCQFGPEFICKDGPVFRYDRIRNWLNIREL